MVHGSMHSHQCGVGYEGPRCSLCVKPKEATGPRFYPNLVTGASKDIEKGMEKGIEIYT